jgi:hypothetical protein
MAAGADRGDDHHSGRLQGVHGATIRRLGEGCDAHLGRDEMLHPTIDVTGIGTQVHPERLVGGRPHLVDGCDHLVEGHGC